MMLVFLVCLIDRVNVGFAALKLRVRLRMAYSSIILISVDPPCADLPFCLRAERGTAIFSIALA